MKKYLIALAAGMLLATTGCVRKPQTDVAGGGATTTTATTTATTSTASASTAVPATGGPATLLKADFPDPGPFKVVEKTEADGTKAEYLEARGDVGNFGGTFRVSTFGSGPKTFNPWVADDVESGGISYLMFDKLVGIDAWTGKAYPRLAKSVTVSPDNLEYTFVMRKGLKWSDGHPLNADDVVFTFDKLVRGGFGNSSLRDGISVYGEYPKITKVDDLTVKFRTTRPFAPMLSGINSVPIAPKHIMEPYTKQPVGNFHQVWTPNMDPKKMVSSGPFILDRYAAGQRVYLKRVPTYGMVDKKGQRLPYLDHFTVAIVPDQNTMILKFLGRELELLDIRSVRGLDAAMLLKRSKAEGFKMYNLGADDGTYFLVFNMNQRKDPKTGKFYVDPIKQKWFNNLNFRQAMSHAINRKQVVSNVLRGVGMPLYTAEPTCALFHNSSLPGYDQDLELSKSLLKQGGFVLKDEKLYDADGNPVEFTLQTNAGNSTREGICNHAKTEFKKLGIKVNFQPIDFNLLVQKTSTNLDWEAIVMALSGSRLEPYEGANVWKSDGRLHLFDQRLPNEKGTVVVTDARPWEKEIDHLFDLGATTLDFEKRKAHYWKHQEIVYKNQPYVYLVSILDIPAVRNTVGNYKPTPLGISYTPMGTMHNIEEIYVAPKSTPN